MGPGARPSLSRHSDGDRRQAGQPGREGRGGSPPTVCDGPDLGPAPVARWAMSPRRRRKRSGINGPSRSTTPAHRPRRRRSRARSLSGASARRAGRAGAGPDRSCRRRRLPGGRTSTARRRGGAASSTRVRASATATPLALSLAAGLNSALASSSSSARLSTSAAVGSSCATPITAPPAPPARSRAVISSQMNARASQPSQPRFDPAGGAPDSRRGAAQRPAVGEPGATRVIVGGDHQVHRAPPPGVPPAPPAARLTTFWLARSGVRRRPSERPVKASTASETSATRIIAPPTLAEPTDTRLPTTASATCQAWARAQLGRHQKVSIFAFAMRAAQLGSSQRQHAARRPSRPRALEAGQRGDCLGGAHRLRMIPGCRVRGRRGRRDRVQPIDERTPRRARAARGRARGRGRRSGRAEPRFGHEQQAVHAKSTPTDLVSEADVAAEDAIRRVLGTAPPRRRDPGEEGGASEGDGDLRWVIDPLDGTINFLFGIPVFAVSVACEDSAGALVGVVLDPIREECFTACARGAELNGSEIVSSQRDSLSEALVATGFGYDASVRASPGRSARPRAAPCARHPPGRRGRAGSGLVRLRPLRRLLRAWGQAVGRGRRRADRRACRAGAAVPRRARR